MIDNPTYLVYKATINVTNADALLSFVGPGIKTTSSTIPLMEQMPDWKHITIGGNIATKTPETLTTGAKFAVLTSAIPDADLTTSSTAATKGDGSTAFETGNITATGEIAPITMSREGASSAVSNIGSVIGVEYDRTSMTAATGTFYITVTK